MALKDFFRFDAGDIPGFVAMVADIASFFRTEPGSSERAEIGQRIIKQHVPHLFGFSRTDEATFEVLRGLMDAEKRRVLDVVISKMEPFERTIFRLTETKGPCGSETKDGKEVSFYCTARDLRVKCLESIAVDVTSRMKETVSENEAAIQVVDTLRTRGVITRNATYQKWCEAIESLKKSFFKTFGKRSLAKAGRRLEAYGQPAPQTWVPGFWESVFGHASLSGHRPVALWMGIMITAALVVTAVVVSIVKSST